MGPVSKKSFLSERAGDSITEVAVPNQIIASDPAPQPATWLSPVQDFGINTTDVGAGPFIAIIEQNRPYLEQYGERHIDLEIPATGDTYRTFKSHLEGSGYRVALRNMRFDQMVKWYDVTVSW